MKKNILLKVLLLFFALTNVVPLSAMELEPDPADEEVGEKHTAKHKETKRTKERSKKVRQDGTGDDEDDDEVYTGTPYSYLPDKKFF